MKQAIIDVGSNTVRMLIADCDNGVPVFHYYDRCITRLAGDFDPAGGLSPAAMQRTVDALCRFAKRLTAENIPCVRAVGTAALRRAPNRGQFIDEVIRHCGLRIEIIDGDEEARLMTAGILSVVRPTPRRAVLLDIGGGSTEIVGSDQGQVIFQQSYPIGVVRLIEEFPDTMQRQLRISEILTEFEQSCAWPDPVDIPIRFIGTAGTITTLAAMHLELSEYNAAAVNNHIIPISWINHLYDKLVPLAPTQREKLPGMEAGRGDLIVAGIETVVALAKLLKTDEITVSDAGLLEGIFIDARL